jgi:hypothetical protein
MWYKNQNELSAFIRYMSNAGFISTSEEATDIMEEPWKWEEEYLRYKESPDIFIEIGD